MDHVNRYRALERPVAPPFRRPRRRMGPAGVVVPWDRADLRAGLVGR